ncbi:OLC1v1028951C1 [Oldenlandia corymbosa var. corymbosa]|uniref:OLC1v1028951C1 n=1 Tax=Oldenlandia corymbosa var. corymbosa TaxID=529605 RepID=A0AAV1CCZ3_OLDCO|nr:OLC1v1028951C1 [Oldenlandia corymbosa var. corymbosa]
MDPKVTEVSQILARFKAAFLRKDYDTCVTLLLQLKVALTAFTSLPPLFENTPNAVDELTLAREVYELAVLLSVKIEDQEAFERDFFQLKPYYTDARNRLPPSAQEYPILGLNLLRLLVQNRIAEFHTELELLPPAALENPCIRHAVELEQSFMEGAYNRVLSARQTVPHETYVYFMDLLAKTVRDEIAGCSEKAYDSMSIRDAQQMLLFSSERELLDYIKEDHPEWEVKNGLVVFQTFKMGSQKTPSTPANAVVSHSDEYFLQHSLVFAESLKDLKNLRIQLYSAADYFESSYKKHEYKQLVVETIKDFANKALINTVDHLGTVAYKVESFLDEKVNEISAARLQFSGLEQKLRTCQGFINRNGILQQSLVIKTPKYYKHYKIPVEESRFRGNVDSVQKVCLVCPEDDNKHLTKPAIQEAVSMPYHDHPPLMRRALVKHPHTESSATPYSFSFVRVTPNQEAGKRSVSPFRRLLKRSGSFANRSTSPNPSATKQRSPSEPRAATALVKYPETSRGKEVEVYSRKTKPLLKALLTMHRSRKQSVPYRFRDGK